MSTPRKRQVRLVVCLTTAVLLASGLIYTSFASSDPALSPTQLLASTHPGSVVQLTGTVVPHTVINHTDGDLDFRLADRATARSSVLVRYSGTVPSAFDPGRELIVTGSLRHGNFIAQKGSMITKCPSKYAAAPSGQ
ncbi:MAG: cytochrome c maturation protein CcmE [Solirubrobacteraceae bacterium]